MNGPTHRRWRAKLLVAGIAGAMAVGIVASLPASAQARVFYAVGAPCCGYWGAYPYYPSPYYYAPPPAYYYPQPTYPGPAYPAPSAYTPQAPSAYPPQAPAAYAPPAASAYMTPGAPAAPSAAVSITYTSKPAFTNAAGQTCREYRTNGGTPVYGTACQQADGQWRVVN
jgi:hypothetical protein